MKRNAMNFSTVMDSIPPELLSRFESLSDPDKPDLIVIPDGAFVYVAEIRNVESAGQNNVAAMHGRANCAKFKEMIAGTSPGTLGCITVMICGDFEKAQTAACHLVAGAGAEQEF